MVSNSPLELVNERCGESSKRVFIVDLFASQQALPENRAEVVMRRDKIVYAERVRSDMRLRERMSDFRTLVQERMENIEPKSVRASAPESALHSADGRCRADNDHANRE